MGIFSSYNPEVTFIENVMQDGRFALLYEQTTNGEKETREPLVRFEGDYPGVTREGNVDEIAGVLQKKAGKQPSSQNCGKSRSSESKTVSFGHWFGEMHRSVSKR